MEVHRERPHDRRAFVARKADREPRGESLLRLSGWPKVEQVLQLIDAVETLDIDPADAAPDYWHHVHNRLSVNERPRPYTRSRHQAWLHRRRMMS
jgi:hypothetical protein